MHVPKSGLTLNRPTDPDPHFATNLAPAIFSYRELATPLLRLTCEAFPTPVR